jgi:deoxyribose-phosphate aldolase
MFAFEPSWLSQVPSTFKPNPNPLPLTRSRIDLAISCLDLTSLSGDDTSARVEQLTETGKACGVAAVCVYPVFVDLAKRHGVRVATVGGEFPHGLSTLEARIKDVETCVQTGADEIDIVIRRQLALEYRWEQLFDEVLAMKKAAADKLLKVILATGELETQERIWKAALVSLMAGADFVKTSTGKEKVNATLEAGTAMASAIAFYREKTGRQAGLKAAGGIKDTEQALAWMSLIERDLGSGCLNPDGFRIGASSLLDDLVNMASWIR